MPYLTDFWGKGFLRYSETFFRTFSHKFSYGKHVLIVFFKALSKFVNISEIMIRIIKHGFGLYC